MNHKRNRTREEKIIDCLDNTVSNLHPSLREILFEELRTSNISNNVVEMTNYVRNKLKIPSMGSHTKDYWIARGWSKVESIIKAKQVYASKNRSFDSPYSREFWMRKINPKTNKYYTEQEADFERNSRRPMKKEYWMNKGFSEPDATIKAKETTITNSKSGHISLANRDLEEIKSSSKRCKEYWILRGYSEKEAEVEVSKIQTTFSLDKCIIKYGDIEGRKIWKDRQEKWQTTLNSKSEEELDRIYRAKLFFGKGYSNISQDLFDEIYKKLENKDVYYATFIRGDIDKGNNEYFYISKSTNKKFLFDFYYPEKNRIIEFDGDYWHGEVRGNIERDETRQNILEEEGFVIMRVKEKDYKSDKQGTVEKCVNFLTQ
jgi:hypothetical protein